MPRLKKVFPALLFLSILSCKPSKKSATYSGEVLVAKPPSAVYSGELLIRKPLIEQAKDTLLFRSIYDPIQLKYANYLKVQPDQLRDTGLYHFIEHWLHTPYKWGEWTNAGSTVPHSFKDYLQKSI